VIDAPPITTPFDFNWSSTVEEGREKKMMATTFTIQPETISEAADLPSDIVCLAESALKVRKGYYKEQSVSSDIVLLDGIWHSTGAL